MPTIGIFNPSTNSPLDSDYGLPFKGQGQVLPFYYACDADKFDLVVFPGGPDVPPSLYGESPRPKTRPMSPDEDLPWPDTAALFNNCVSKNIPMVGICGGMQFLSVMNGCRLIQHIVGHNNTTHEIIIFEPSQKKENRVTYPNTITGKIIKVAGDHHQAIGSDEVIDNRGEILANDYPTDIVEACWFPKTKSLGVQFHPEWMDRNSDGYKYFKFLLQKYINI